MKNILVVSAHPDDETLGMGGTLMKLKGKGDKLSWLIMTNLCESGGYDGERIKERQIEIEKVAEYYGFSNVFKLDYPTTMLDTISKKQIVDSVVRVVKEVVPTQVYVPFKNDVHSDHRVTFDTVVSSTKSFNHERINKILCYETVSETEFAPSLQEKAFVPNNYSDITEYLDSKLEVLQLYKGEYKPHPFPRSIENVTALATFRGATAGVKYAEAFVVIKERW